MTGFRSCLPRTAHWRRRLHTATEAEGFTQRLACPRRYACSVTSQLLTFTFTSSLHCYSSNPAVTSFFLVSYGLTW